MSSVRRGFSLVLILINTISILALPIIESAYAQVGVITPSTPNFSVTYLVNSQIIPPVYGVDQSTGKAVITKASYTLENEKVWIDIANQPFVPYNDSNGNTINLFYNIRYKAPNNNSWINSPGSQRLIQSYFGYTLSSFDFKGNYNPGVNVIDLPKGGQTDFQVEAIIGYFTAENVFVGKTSGWTNPQEVQPATLPINSPSTSPSPNPTSSSNPAITPTSTPTTTNSTDNPISVPLNTLIAVVAVFLIIIFVLSLLLFRKRQKNISQNKPNV